MMERIYLKKNEVQKMMERIKNQEKRGIENDGENFFGGKKGGIENYGENIFLEKMKKNQEKGGIENGENIYF